MLTLFGNPGSTCTRKVLTTLYETGTAFEFVSIDFSTGEHKQPAHLARQPFGQVPTINDDGFELYESRAICRYLNEKAHGALIPTEVQSRAIMEEWISIETSSFTGHAMKFVYEHLMKRPQGEAALAAATTGLETALGVMEKRLAEKPYLAGDVFSIADIAFMPYVEYGMMTPAKEIYGKYPHFLAWWERVSARPSWQKAAGKA